MSDGQPGSAAGRLSVPKPFRAECPHSTHHAYLTNLRYIQTGKQQETFNDNSTRAGRSTAKTFTRPSTYAIPLAARYVEDSRRVADRRHTHDAQSFSESELVRERTPQQISVGVE